MFSMSNGISLHERENSNGLGVRYGAIRHLEITLHGLKFFTKPFTVSLTCGEVNQFTRN